MIDIDKWAYLKSIFCVSATKAAPQVMYNTNRHIQPKIGMITHGFPSCTSWPPPIKPSDSLYVSKLPIEGET